VKRVTFIVLLASETARSAAIGRLPILPKS
jgi:hypothetical protein